MALKRSVLININESNETIVEALVVPFSPESEKEVQRLKKLYGGVPEMIKLLRLAQVELNPTNTFNSDRRSLLMEEIDTFLKSVS